MGWDSGRRIAAGMVGLAVTLLAGVTMTPAVAQPGPDRVVLDDHFTGKTLDPAKWSPLVGRSSKGAEVFEPSNDVVDNGTLHIESRRVHNGTVTSGGIFSSASIRYGRVDVVARLPQGDGLWPTLWLRGYDSKGGQINGEIDLFEAFGSHPTSFQSTVHHWVNGKESSHPDCVQVGWFRDNGCQIGKSVPSTNLHAAYHHYGVVWKPGWVTFLFDGKPYFTTNHAVPNIPMELVTSVQIGGFWDGAPDASTPFPTSMDITHIQMVQAG